VYYETLVFVIRYVLCPAIDALCTCLGVPNDLNSERFPVKLCIHTLPSRVVCAHSAFLSSEQPYSERVLTRKFIIMLSRMAVASNG
jgi:hypothetical protein